MAKSTRETSVCMDLGRDLTGDFARDVRDALSCASSKTLDFGASYFIDNLLSKYPFSSEAEIAPVRRDLAISKLISADLTCQNLNENGYRSNISPETLNGLLKTAQSLIANLMSGFEHKLQGSGIFSNGASMGFKLQDAAPYKKFAGKATVTPRAYKEACRAVNSVPTWRAYMQATYGDESNWFKLVGGNGIFTVPKNAKIDRAAAKEPCMNMYLQKSVGSFIRNRLRTIGIDLNDQSRNQDLARRSSIDNSLATIDLSAASDSISDRLVWDLLPPDMYSYLDMIRSHRAFLPDGTYHKWALFSTMGNGFTFELESMIFWSLTRAVCLTLGVHGDIGIYGDDIIIPVEGADLLIKLLEACNFSTNTEKTFLDGPFRESCGGHYFNGTDVKPIYLRRKLDNLSSLMLALNRLRGWGVVSGISDPRLFDIWSKYAAYVPKVLWGGCSVDRDDYLVTPDYPRKRVHSVTKVLDGFNGPFSDKNENGRLINWLHLGSGNISDTKKTNRLVLKANKEWSVAVPTFPQEVGLAGLPC